jgi:predicted RNase H-like HicB family nuclease
VRYLVRIYREGDDYSAMVPDLPGCVASGDSVEEVRDLIAEAIRLHVDMMRRSGETVPAPTRTFDLDVDELEDGELCTWVDVKPVRGRAAGRR